MKTKIISLMFGLIMLGLSFQSAAANGISDIDKYSWSENAGYFNWKPGMADAVNVDIEGGYISNYIWGENIGWIKLASDNFNPASSQDSTNYGILVTMNAQGGVDLSGHAWSENTGWINFNPGLGQQVTINQQGQFEGYAWSENLGWISMSDFGGATRYGVTTDQLRVTGDVNGDKILNNTDITALVNILDNNGDIATYPGADIDGDGDIDILDLAQLFYLINKS